MTARFLALICFIFVFTTTMHAQLGGGVRIGLNFSNIKGPSEQDASGASLESMDRFTGFLIGPSFAYSFSDNFGLRGEVLYSKKGMKYTYNGPSERSFLIDGSQSEYKKVQGNEKVSLVMSHTNLDLPLMAFARFGKFEISGGVYASLLFTKVADGSLDYSWPVAKNDGSGFYDEKINHTLTYNYNKDKFGEGDSESTVTAYFNEGKTQKSTLPKTLGAYYDYPDDKGNLYNLVDYGVSAGASFFLSRSLFIGARLQYGLADLTNNNADLSRYARNTDGTAVLRNDKDYNYTIQAYVGFSLR